MLRDCGRALSQMLGTGTCCRGRGQAGAESCFGITWTAGLTHFTGPRPVRARVVTCYGVVDEVCHSCRGWAFVAGLGVGPGQSQARAASRFGISWTTGLSHVTGPRPARAGAVTLRGCGRFFCHECPGRWLLAGLGLSRVTGPGRGLTGGHRVLEWHGPQSCHILRGYAGTSQSCHMLRCCGRILSKTLGTVSCCRACVVTCYGARPGPGRGQAGARPGRHRILE